MSEISFEADLKLKDGRRLAYGLYGRRDGIPIVDFHGIPGSRREASLVSSLVAREDLCLIGFDRPGYGRSTPLRSYRICDISADLAALMDHLGIDRFIALGFSGGAPFALACAAHMPQRIAALGIVSGVGPSEIGSAGMHETNRRKFNLAQKYPALARWLLTRAFSGLRSQPGRLEGQLNKIWEQMPDPDRRALSDQRLAGGIISVTRDAIQSSVSGWVGEELLMARSWGFELQAVTSANIQLWHGVEDRNVPLAMAQAVAARLPGCQANFVAHEGHISLLFNHGAEIIDRLVCSIAGR